MFWLFRITNIHNLFKTPKSEDSQKGSVQIFFRIMPFPGTFHFRFRFFTFRKKIGIMKRTVKNCNIQLLSNILKEIKKRAPEHPTPGPLGE